jgi:hypothetical protein
MGSNISKSGGSKHAKYETPKLYRILIEHQIIGCYPYVDEITLIIFPK